MGDNTSVFRKLILVEADTTGLQKLNGDLPKAQAMLNGFGMVQEKAKSITTSTIPVMDKFGKVTEQTLVTITTESGKTVNAMLVTGKAANTMAMDFERAAKRALVVVPTWFLLRTAFMALLNALGQGINFWKEFESAMAEIRIASDATKEEVKSLGDTILALAIVTGTSATESLKAAKIFAQQGLSMGETLSATRAAMIGAKILGQDIITVAENLTAAVRSYNLSFGDSISIIDKWMGVQRKHAVTAKDLADATKTAGATASAMGVSYDAFLGNVTAIIEVTRKSGSQAANALQMIYSRLLTQGSQVVQSIGKVPIYLDAQNKATIQNTASLRQTEDVLYDLSFRWKDLNENQKLQIALQVASRRQLTPFIALMENYNRSLEAQVDSLKASGEAQRGLSIIFETTQYKMEQLKSSALSLAEALSQTGMWKVMIAGTNELLTTLTLYVDKLTWFKDSIVRVREEQLKYAESNESTVESLRKLIEMRDRFEKKKSSVPEEYKSQVESLIARVNSAINALASPAAQSMGILNTDGVNRVLELATKRKIKAQVQIEMSGQEAEIREMQRQLKFNPFDSASWGNRKERELEIQGRINQYNKDLAETVDERYATSKNNLDLKKEEADFDSLLLEQTKQQELLLKHNTDILRMRGATEREILDYQLKQYQTISELAAGDKNGLKVAELKYEKEKLITQELEKRLKLSSDEIKIYDIAQKYGTYVAEDIAKAIKLQGNAIRNLSGVALNVFQKEFSGYYKNYQAQDFFRNEPELKRWLSSYGGGSDNQGSSATWDQYFNRLIAKTPEGYEKLIPKLDNRIHLTIKVEE